MVNRTREAKKICVGGASLEGIAKRNLLLSVYDRRQYTECRGDANGSGKRGNRETDGSELADKLHGEHTRPRSRWCMDASNTGQLWQK